MYCYEREIFDGGCELIGGIDEAGRGPLAGPVVAACVIMPKNLLIEGVDDSKRLSAKTRERLFGEIMKAAVSVSVGAVSEKVIDEINILQATYEAMRRAVAGLSVAPDYLLCDAVTIPKILIPQRGIVKGDQKSHSIAAASIIAKVTRDRMMTELDGKYPLYGFARHKGYGTAAHIAAIRAHGACEIHRRTFIGRFVGASDES